MFASLRQIFRATPIKPRPAVPENCRFYVVGDIHGRLDLFTALIDAIERDVHSSPPAQITVVLLGDLIDRGPDSAGVVERALRWREQRDVILLAGNHEEMFLNSFEDLGVLRHFLRHGGRQTVLSYGVDREVYDSATFEQLQEMMRAKVPREHLDFLSSASDHLEAGDYLFVHAGISPDVPLADQQKHHLRWIREPFLDHSAPYSHFVVHGHTITDGIDARSNRIGIDTGAYRTGQLTALVLEGADRRLLQTTENEQGISIQARDYPE
jgi:serine/threonine protein phosphatase 1